MWRIIALIVLLAGCSPIGNILDLTKTYRYDLEVEVKETKQKFKGVGVLPPGSLYTLKLTWDERAEFMKFTTCHREEVIEFGHSKRAEYVYTPNVLEASGFCPISIAAYDTKGKHSFAYLIPRRSTHTMSAFMNCNGKNQNWIGAGICQSKSGLFQRIAFDKPVTPVTITSQPRKRCNKKGDECVNITCPDVICDNTGSCEYQIPKSICDYGFHDKKGKLFHLTTLGYDEAIIRRHDFN